MYKASPLGPGVGGVGGFVLRRLLSRGWLRSSSFVVGCRAAGFRSRCVVVVAVVVVVRFRLVRLRSSAGAA